MRSTSAPRSAGVSPAYPSRIGAARGRSSNAAASVGEIGRVLKARSARRSESSPDSPNEISDPKIGWSATRIVTATPLVAIFCT